MSAEPPFEQFTARGRSPLGWLAAEPGQREGLALGLLLAVLACLPVLVATYPQMVDYPAHLARYHVMLERANSPFLQRYYGFEWHWVGNLGADLLIRPLAALFGLEAAGRIIATLIPLLTGLGIVTVEWTLRKRIGIGTLLAMAFIWSPALLLGFLNFGLSLAFALFAFALWVRLEGRKWRAALFVPLGLAVWLCHLSGWGALGVMVFGHEWSRAKSWHAFVAPWPLMLPILIMAWGVIAAGGASADGEPLVTYGPMPWVYKWAIWKQAMRDSLHWLDTWSVAGVGAVLGLSLAASLALRRFRDRFDGRLGWGAVIMLVLSIALPRHIVGGDYVDARLISTGLMVGCIALAWRAPRWIFWLVPLLFLSRLALTTERWERESRETTRLLAMIDHLPQGARVASLVVTERYIWGYNTQEHIGGYAVVRKDALANMHFALPGVHMLTLREGGPLFRDPWHRILHPHGAPLDLATYAPARDADWLWYVGRQEPGRLPPGAEVVRRAPRTLLARLKR